MNILPWIGNIGAGGQVFKQKTAANLHELRSIVAGAGIGVAQNANDITISATGTIPTDYLDIQWLKADLFQGGEPSSFTPAPREEIVLPNGNKFRAVKFVAGEETVAHCHFPFPDNVPGYPGISYLERFYWLTDNADTSNAVNWKIGFKHYAAGDSLDAVVGTWSAGAQPSSGVNCLNTRTTPYSYNGPDPADAVLAMCQVVRQGDDEMPGSAWLIGVRISIGLPL
jgi:hypothetical protein